MTPAALLRTFADVIELSHEELCRGLRAGADFLEGKGSRYAPGRRRRHVRPKPANPDRPPMTDEERKQARRDMR